jgi:hypothetical protein
LARPGRYVMVRRAKKRGFLTKAKVKGQGMAKDDHE